MDDHRMLRVLVIDDEIETDSAEGRQMRAIIHNLETMDFPIIEAVTAAEGKRVFLAYADVGCVVLDWDLARGADNTITPCEIISAVRERSADIPLLLLTEKLTVHEIPPDVLTQIDGYIWRLEDTPEFIAGRIEEAVRTFYAALLPPFFGELTRYVREYKYAWHTPGHAGGMGFMRSAIGRVFFDFFGENVFRSDLSISVPELGSLLDHSGVVGQAEANAARVFGADRTVFVTNGTSTANRIVWNANVNPGDIVLVDRNCHKSIMYAIIMTGAIPIYLVPTRNNFGIIGPIRSDEFKHETLTRKLRENALTRERVDQPIRHASITNNTYDGVSYNVEMVKDQLAGVVESVHFDEAWYGYAKFHPLFNGHYAMSPGSEKPEHPIIYATQSTHKVLAAFSQGSMIHIRDHHKAPTQRVAFDRFNEAFMMHGSTSPQYSIIASLDVGAQMMAGSSGAAIMRDVMEEALVFRQKMLQVEAKEEGWWFHVWQPQPTDHDTIDTQSVLAEDQAMLRQDYWVARANDTWHGFDDLVDDYVLLDPTRVTILSPGIDTDGSMSRQGIPASVLSLYLMQQGVVAEKTGFYSILFLFTLGVTKGKSGTLLAELYQFRRLYTANAPLQSVFPSLVEAFPIRYASLGLRDLCDEMHDFLRTHQIARTMKQVYDFIPPAVMSPAEAYQHVVSGMVEAVDLDHLIGRTAAVMVVPYPPGIPIWMPGEQLAEQARDIQAYLRIYLDFDNRFPGFENDIHGVIKRRNAQGAVDYAIYCVADS